jgi:steroid delta-isomerase-like uncharacterized protein
MSEIIPAKNQALVERFYHQLWNAWDDTAVDNVLTEDFAFRGSLGTQTVGRDGWRAYRDLVRAASPDFRNQIVDLVCQEDRAAAHVVCTGRHDGVLLGIPASDRRFRYDVAAFFTFRGSQIAVAWVLGDLDGLRRQLV